MNAESRIGEQNINTQGLVMKIVDYVNAANVLVTFENGFSKRCTYSSFKNGNVRNSYIPTVCGVGIIGNGKSRINGKVAKEYSLWRAIIKRCYSDAHLKYSPNYKDVSVCDEWLYYPNFYNWLINQDNYSKFMDEDNKSKFDIDKDILMKGNKVYSPSTCCLVPEEINSLFVKSNSKRGKYPLGVDKIHRNGKEYFRYRVSLGKGKRIEGLCKNVDDAFIHYKTIKENFIKESAQLHYEQGNITQNCFEAMMNYEVEITD